ncbi:hypothetical protein ACFVYT_30055 [Streptomyces sp. NPDC058290]|uniref:hypothetical protein n=1 Tax=Streptomyces sp. NPDC058290 TaxID=3346426 RepID=UPI0036EF2826
MTSELAAYRTLVLEGCDGAGKSTLAALFAARHGFTVIHSPRTPDLTARYLAQGGRLILDRSFISELVYGPLLRGASRIPGHRHTTWPRPLPTATEPCATSPPPSR